MVRGSAEDGVEAMVAYRRRITVGAGLLALPLPGTAALDQFAARRAAKDAVHKSHRVRTRDGDIRDVDDDGSVELETMPLALRFGQR